MGNEIKMMRSATPMNFGSRTRTRMTALMSFGSRTRTVLGGSVLDGDDLDGEVDAGVVRSLRDDLGDVISPMCLGWDAI